MNASAGQDEAPNVAIVTGAARNIGRASALALARMEFDLVVHSGSDQAGAGETAALVEAEGARVTRPRYPLLHQQPLFVEGHWARIARLTSAAGPPLPTYDPQALPRTVAGNQMLLKLPSFPRASRRLLDQYAAAFAKTVGHALELRRAES